MRGLGAGQAEVFRGRDQALSEVLQPYAIDQEPRHRRMLRRGQPAGQR